VLSISYGIGRLPVFSTEQEFDGMLWRLYTDGGCALGSVSCSAVLFFGNIEVFRIWGNVQMRPRGHHWEGARKASSTTGEISAPLLFARVIQQLQLWCYAQPTASRWPSNHLLLCVDSSSAVKILAGSAVGGCEPALSARVVDTLAALSADMNLSIAIQKVPSHIAIPGNVLADELATLALTLEPGTYKYRHTAHADCVDDEGVNISTSLSLNLALGFPRLDSWPPDPLISPTRHGAQSTAYSHWKGRLWGTGKVHDVLRVRLLKWWGVNFTCSWFTTLMHRLRSFAPRLKWCLFTALLGEWPTGQRMRHILTPGAVCPVCRFCGSHQDSVQHWFGRAPCVTLWTQLQRSLALPSIPCDGWFTADIGDAVWTSLLSAVYSVHCQLRWGYNDTSISNIALLREGVWLSRAQELCAISLDSDTKEARKKTARRQAALRSRVKKNNLRNTLLHCINCGAVYLGLHVNCPMTSVA
jgi:hypothetical protein